LKRGLITIHCEKDCELQAIPCKYCKWGCPTEIARKHINVHYETDLAMHLELGENFIAANEERMVATEARIAEVQASHEELLRRYGQANEENIYLRLTVEGLASLKPSLPHHHLNSEPMILPCSLITPEHPEATVLISVEPDNKTVSYQQPTKFFPSKVLPIKAVLVRSDRMIPNANITYYFEVTVKKPWERWCHRNWGSGGWIRYFCNAWMASENLWVSRRRRKEIRCT